MPVRFQRSMTYLLYGEEVAPTTGTKHYQGYVQFEKKKNLTGARKAIPGAHMEIARAPLAKNQEYCKKSGKVHEEGKAEEIEPEQRKQGNRSDLKNLMNDIKEGKSRFELMEAHPEAMAKYSKFADEYRQGLARADEKEIVWPVKLPWATIDKPEPSLKKRHLWIWGPPDLGKTYEVSKAVEGMKVYFTGQEVKYRFEGYDDQELIVFDDTKVTLDELLDCSNTYLHAKERAGGSRYVRTYWKKKQTRTMIVLSNHPPPFEDESFKARFNVIEVKA